MKALVMCSKKSNPDIILIIFFYIFSILFTIKELLQRCKIHIRVNKSKIQKFQTILRNQVFNRVKFRFWSKRPPNIRMFETVLYLDTFFSSMINLNKELEMVSVKKKHKLCFI